MPEMIATDHMVTWTEWNEKLRAFHHASLRRGQRGEVPEEVIEHLKQASEEKDAYGRPVDGRPRLLSPEDYEAWNSTEAVRREPVNRFSDEDIQHMQPEDLLAKMNSIPGFAQRALDLENEREKPRKPIIGHAQRVLDAEKGDDVSLAVADPVVPLVPSRD